MLTVNHINSEICWPVVLHLESVLPQFYTEGTLHLSKHGGKATEVTLCAGPLVDSAPSRPLLIVSKAGPC